MGNDGIEIMEFTCPRCGSHKFGSFTENGKLVRHCNGEFEGRSCLFMWHEWDDAKWMHGTGVWMPSFVSAPGRIQ